jgi:hypothetical protein
MIRLLLGATVALAFFAGRTPAVSFPVEQPATAIDQVIPANVDIYGNEVEPAVGGYRVDLDGDLYEEHNPDTAVLELGPPTS